eukprot:364890-Chlamydomonas_euryale.AAC.3
MLHVHGPWPLKRHLRASWCPAAVHTTGTTTASTATLALSPYASQVEFQVAGDPLRGDAAVVEPFKWPHCEALSRIAFESSGRSMGVVAIGKVDRRFSCWADSFGGEGEGGELEASEWVCCRCLPAGRACMEQRSYPCGGRCARLLSAHVMDQHPMPPFEWQSTIMIRAEADGSERSWHWLWGRAQG